MSSADQHTKLAYWLPKLEVYRAAIEASPEVSVSIPDPAEREVPSVLSEVSVVGRICRMRISEERDAVSVMPHEPEADESTYLAKPTIAAETIVSETIDSVEDEVSIEDEVSTDDEVSADDEVPGVADATAEELEDAVVVLPQLEPAIELQVERIEEKQPIEVIPHLPAFSVYVAEESAAEESVAEESTLPSHDSENRVALPHVLHLPIDGIVKKLKGLKPFVLGIGTVGKSETQWNRQVVRDAVNRCCDKTGRNAILVSVRPSGYSNADEKVSRSDTFREVDWTYFGDSKAETKAWHNQLSDLPKWKKEFGLIIFDLGDVRLPTMPRIGRLCDGIVVQLQNAANSRDTIQALKGLQKDRLKILGVWSVELNARSLAA